MKQIQLNEEVSISNVVHGVWRLSEWGLDNAQIIQLVEQCLELGIDTFDHADIYGNYMCEELFGNALSQVPALNQKIKVVSKCGIKLLSSNRPKHYIKHYDTSYGHIIWSVDNSLRKLQKDNLDVLLLHRPDPFIDPEEVARAFDQLKTQGKVKAFGLSNFLPSQFTALQSYLDFKLVTNQVEISVAALQEFDNGTIDHCQEHRIHPMAWSPLAGGAIFTAETHRFLTIRNVLHKIGKQYDASIDQMMYAWLFAHPVGIIPIVGSGKIERIKTAVEAQNIPLTRQQWFELWTASKGQTVP